MTRQQRLPEAEEAAEAEVVEVVEEVEEVEEVVVECRAPGLAGLGAWP